jgi:Predicted membrane protein
MRKLASFLDVLASIALVGALFVVGVQMVALRPSFFDQEYRKLDSARRLHSSHSSLMEATTELLDYIKGKDVDLSETRVRIGGETRRAFDSNEVQHMVDVKDLYQGARIFQGSAVVLIAIAVLLHFTLPRKDRWYTLVRSYATTVGGIAAVVGVFAIWMSVDFYSFWNAFHTLFFRNMLWQMDPNTSFMINMLETQLWIDICSQVLIILAVTAGGLLVLSIVFLGVRRYRRHTLLTLDLEEDELTPVAVVQSPKIAKQTPRPASNQHWNVADTDEAEEWDAPWHGEQWEENAPPSTRSEVPRSPWQQP